MGRGTVAGPEFRGPLKQKVLMEKKNAKRELPMFSESSWVSDGTTVFQNNWKIRSCHFVAYHRFFSCPSLVPCPSPYEAPSSKRAWPAEKELVGVKTKEHPLFKGIYFCAKPARLFFCKTFSKRQSVRNRLQWPLCPLRRIYLPNARHQNNDHKVHPRDPYH